MIDLDWFFTLGNQEANYRTLFLFRGCFQYSSHLCTHCWRRESRVVRSSVHNKSWWLAVPTNAQSGACFFCFLNYSFYTLWSPHCTALVSKIWLTSARYRTARYRILALDTSSSSAELFLRHSRTEGSSWYLERMKAAYMRSHHEPFQQYVNCSTDIAQNKFCTKILCWVFPVCIKLGISGEGWTPILAVVIEGLLLLALLE
jgi:hypothetical protein